jgi:hypothetical protein
VLILVAHLTWLFIICKLWPAQEIEIAEEFNADSYKTNP